MPRKWSGVGIGMITFLALAFMLNDIQMVWGVGGRITFLHLHSNVECYATGLGGGMITFLKLIGLGWGG